MNEIIISPKKSWKALLNELWEYREVFFFLGWRDILVQYKQTVIGILWIVVRPLLTVAIFTIIFSKIAGISSKNVPYALLVFSGMLVWQFFADTLVHASHSFLTNAQLISKTYFPRVMLPASRLLCSVVDLAIAFVFYLAISMGYYRVFPSIYFLLLPIFVLWLAIISLSLSLIFAPLIVRYRDFRHIIPFFIQLGVYCTPVGFSLSIVPGFLKILVALNPLSGVINGFRFCLFNEPLYVGPLIVSLIVTVFLSITSVIYFKRSEEFFADLI